MRGFFSFKFFKCRKRDFEGYTYTIYIIHYLSLENNSSFPNVPRFFAKTDRKDKNHVRPGIIVGTRVFDTCFFS